MEELFHLKYPEVYDPQEEEIFETIEEDGTVMQIPLLAPLSLHTPALTDPNFRLKLRNFEEDPIAFFEDRKIQFYLFKVILRDYNTDPICRSIINRCLEYGLPPNAAVALMISSAEYNLEDLFFEVFDSYNAMELYYTLGSSLIFQDGTVLIDSLILHGRYSWVKRMMTRGFSFFWAGYCARLTCTNGPASKVDEAIDFLDFLINKREEIGVDTLVQLKRYSALKAPLLNVLLSSAYPKAYKEAVGRFLMRSGADSTIPTGPDRITALELAEKQGIDLFED